jgi:hypothetical protein
MIQILPKAKMGENPKVGLTQMHKDGNLQDRIRVQMGQIQIIEIKEAMEEGRNGKSKAANKRNIDDGLVGVLCRNSDPSKSTKGITLLEAEPQHQQDGKDRILKQQTCGYPRMSTDYWGRWEE